MAEIRAQLEEIFFQVFGREIPLENHVSAKDVDDWDSLQHINLIVAIEKHFKIRFATAEISSLKEEGKTVQTLLEMIQTKTANRI